MAGKFTWEAGELKPIQIKDLVCKDCFHCIPVRVDICSEFPDIKPSSVLAGKDCPKYKGKG